MASTYSTLAVQLMGTGDNNTTWGVVTNANLGTVIEESIVGSADVAFASADVTLTLSNSTISQNTRNLRLVCTGATGGSTRNLIIPKTTGSPAATFEKPYIVQNNCADSIVVKHSTGTGVTVPTGKTMWVYADGTNVVDVVTHLSSLALGTALPVASGGTGVTAPGTAGNVLTSDGTAWVSQASGGGGGGGGVTSITFGTTGLTPATASNGVVSVAGTLVVSNGGTGRTSHTSGAVLIGAGTAALTSLSPGTAGNVIVSNGTAWVSQPVGGTGTVTSVAMSVPAFLTVSGSPITTTGTLAVTLSGTALPVANGGTGATSAGAALAALGAAASGVNTDITALDQDVVVTATGTVAANTIGYRGIPQNAQTGAYTLALSDQGKHISITTGGVVVPANGSVAFPIGATISIYNNSGSSQTISITTDTMYLAGTATTGSRTLAQRGVATAIKVDTTTWVISGGGLT